MIGKAICKSHLLSKFFACRQIYSYLGLCYYSSRHIVGPSMARKIDKHKALN